MEFSTKVESIVVVLSYVRITFGAFVFRYSRLVGEPLLGDWKCATQRVLN